MYETEYNKYIESEGDQWHVWTLLSAKKVHSWQKCIK